MAIPESIKQKANKIRNEVYGKDVREALASGIEEAGDIADQTRERQDFVEAQFQSVLDETTGKDVISAPEITAARVGADDTNHPNLKTRLDTEYNQLSSQLAQKANQIDLEEIELKKADKIHVEALDRNKVDKNGAGQVTWAMAAQDFREQITGGNTAVVGKDSVLEENVVDGAITFRKRSRLGEIAIIHLQNNNTLPPDINTEKKTITFYPGTYIYVGNTRYEITDETSVSLADGQFVGVGKSMQNIVYDTKTGIFRVINSVYAHETNESEVLVATINWNSNNQGKINYVHISSRYTINGKEMLSNTLYYYMNFTGKDPNIDTKNKTLTFYGEFYIVSNMKRYRFSDDIVIKLDDVPTTGRALQFVVFDGTKFKVMNSNYIHEFAFNDSVIMTINWDGNGQNNIKSVFFTNKYTIDGKDPFSQETKQEKPYYFPPDDLVGHYIPSDDHDYSEFSYQGTSVTEMIGKFSDLAAEHSDYIEEIYLGVDQSDTYPIYKYRLKPKNPDSDRLEKTLPKILIACTLHGSEKMSTWSLYYFMKDLCENWQSNPLLEYMRFNVEFVIIPIVNPWGYQENKRTNSRDVDLNRNFDYDWVQYVDSGFGSVLYCGEHPFSEKEAQYVRDMVLDNPDALYFCDYHTKNDTGDNYHDLMWFLLTDHNLYNENLDIAQLQIINKMSREFVKRYDLPSNEGLFGYVTHYNSNGTARAWGASEGIPSNTTECFRGFPTEPLYSDKAKKACTEYIGNWIGTVLKQFKQNY